MDKPREGVSKDATMRERMKKSREAIKKTKENDKFYLKRKNKLTHRLFFAMLVMFLLLALIETVWQGSLTTNLNLNFLIIIVIVLVFSLLTTKEETRIPREVTTKDYALIAVTGVACILIVCYKIQSLGWFSYAISTMAGMLVILTSILTMKEE